MDQEGEEVKSSTSDGSLSDEDEQETPQSPATNPQEADADVSMDQVDLEESVSLAELLNPELSQIKEFQEILQMGPDPPKEDRPSLYDVPEISGLFEGAVNRVQQQFSPKLVLTELQNIYHVLAISRTNENSLKARLARKEEELANLNQKMRRDPRVYRALVLAGEWRKEKDAELQASKEYQMAVDTMKTDMKDLENKIHSLQNANARLHKDLLKVPKLEDSIRNLEEIVLRKENAITLLNSEVEKYKQEVVEDALREADQLKDVYLKTSGESGKSMSAEEIENEFKQKLALMKAEHRRQVEEIEMELQCTRCAEVAASHNFRSIAKSVKSMKQQLKTLELNLAASNRQNVRLLNGRKQYDKRIADLEDQNRKLKQMEEDTQQMLTDSLKKNERLKELLGSLASIGKMKSEHISLRKSFREKEREIATCNKNEHRLEKDLKYTTMNLNESFRLRDTQQRELNSTKQLVIMSKQNLSEALRYNDVLFKRLEWTEAYLKYYQRRFDACTGDNIDILNTLKHLESLCMEHEATIRIKDSKNDSLVLGLSNLEELLKDAHSNIHNLRQANLMAQTNHLRQMELNDMMTQLLKFTEAEKVSAVNECNKNVDTVLLLQKQLVLRMNRIASQYKDICDLKTTIDKHLQMLDLQKKETNALRDLLAEIRQEDIAKKNKLKSLVQERDAFGVLVIEKNIIVQLLEKKIKLLHTLIERGATHYRCRIYDIRLLKLEVKNLRHKLAAKETVVDVNFELRHELVRTCRQLQNEQNKRKAIEELKTPKPHRYITLKSRDPSQYEQIVKIHKLQRLLIVKYQEATKKENAIMNRDMQIQKMKLLLLRRFGENIHEQLHTAKAAVSRKNKQIKGLLGEINVLTYDLNQSRIKLNQVLGELKIAKEEIAKQKRLAIKGPCPPAGKASDLKGKSRMANDDFSVAFYRSHFKLKPLHYVRQHQRQHRMKTQMEGISTDVSNMADEVISRSLELQNRGI